jgi:hypothetical protein
VTRNADANPSTLGATHHLSIATNSALQQFRILWTMDGTNFVFKYRGADFRLTLKVFCSWRLAENER